MFIERSKDWRKFLGELNEEQRKEFYNKLGKAIEENEAYQREYAIKYWEQRKEKELLEYMKKYKRETIHIKSSFHKKTTLYINYPKLKIIYPVAKICSWNLVSQLTTGLNPNIKFYIINAEDANDIRRAFKHERMLRYMRTKYPIEY